MVQIADWSGHADFGVAAQILEWPRRFWGGRANWSGRANFWSGRANCWRGCANLWSGCTETLGNNAAAGRQQDGTGH